MQFIDLKKQMLKIESSVQNRIQNVLTHGKFIMGPEVKELENSLAEFCGAKHCISCSSGTDALLMGLMAKDIGPGDAIFTSPFTFIASAEVIELLGATPVFVDIDPRTFNMDPEKLEKAVARLKNGKKPSSGSPENLTARGIIAIDIFGLPADYDAIGKVAEKHNLFVFEDAAQSFGGHYKGQKAGNIGDLAATSFFPAKPLGCYGDGGAVFTNDDDLAEIMASIRVHGKGTEKYDNVRIGLNARIDTLQAAILLSKLEIFPEELELRQKVAFYYSRSLEGLVTVPFIPENCQSAWAQYSVLSEKKNRIMAGLKEKGIPTAVYYPKPLHLQTAFSYLSYANGSMPVSEETSEKIFSLPMHPYLEREEQEQVIKFITNT